jgi:hypothetical protein
MPNARTDDELVKTLIALTRSQHEWLRRRAFDGRTPIAAEIRGVVANPMSSETKRRPAATTPPRRAQ